MDHYISLHNKITVYSDRDIVDRFDGKIIVFDEIHNIRDIGSKERSQSVYMSLLRMVKLCGRSKFIFSSATPMVDSHSQMESVHKLLVSNTTGMGFVSFNSIVIEKPSAKYFGTRNDYVIPRIELVRMKGHQKLGYSKEESTTKVFDIYKKLTQLCSPSQILRTTSA